MIYINTEDLTLIGGGLLAKVYKYNKPFCDGINSAVVKISPMLNPKYAIEKYNLIKATPKSDYLFDQWSDGNQDAERTVTVSRDNMTLVATFYQEGTQRPSEVEPELPPAE